MRTLLIGTGVCLTAATFVAAERVTSFTASSNTLESQIVLQADLDEQKKQIQAEFTARIAALKNEKEGALSQVDQLSSTVQDLTVARDDLASQIESAKISNETADATLTQLEAANNDLVQQIMALNADLTARENDLGALNAEIERLSSIENIAAAPALQGDEQLSSEVARLNDVLASRDETIASLQASIDASESTAISVAEDAESQNAALVEELDLARAKIDDLSDAAVTQSQESEARLAAISETLREREAELTQLQSELEAQVAAAEAASAPAVESTEQADALQSLQTQLAELTELTEYQSDTISMLRMGFEEQPAAAEMANACIERANKIFEISQIKFGVGNSSISESSVTTLDHLRDLAIGCESEKMYIEIGGHTDSRGADGANQQLSEARANSVRDFLISRGIPEDTMVAVGFGETQPIATNDTEVGRAQNRRITFTWLMRDEPTSENIEG